APSMSCQTRKNCENAICRSRALWPASVVLTGRGHRPRLQRNHSPVAVALWTTPFRMKGSSWSRFAQRSGYSGILLGVFLTSTIASAEIRPADCADAARYSESKRGISMLVMQNGRTIFEHYANGGSARRRWPIFSGTKSFWGIAALAAVRDGLFKLDELVSDTITDWKS